MVLSDIEIANSVTMKPIEEIAESIGINKEDLSLYGKYKAKINNIKDLDGKDNGKLILVTLLHQHRLEKVKLRRQLA